MITYQSANTNVSHIICTYIMHLFTYIEYLCCSNDILYVRNVCLVLRGKIQLFVTLEV